MKSFSFAKVLTLGCVVCLSLPVACGDDETNPPAKAGSNAGGEAGAGPVADGGAGGAGGAAPAIMIPGTSDAPKTVKCGTEMCSSVSTLAGLYVDPCCVDDACGVMTPFFASLGADFGDATCQAVGQVGDLDEACPNSADQVVPVNNMMFSVPGFAGCCRAETGTCGVVIDDISVTGVPLPFASPGLGCVDSAPFFEQKAGAACGAGVGGGGGAGGASAGGAPSGAGAGAGGAGAGGAPSGGAGGNQ